MVSWTTVGTVRARSGAVATAFGGSTTTAPVRAVTPAGAVTLARATAGAGGTALAGPAVVVVAARASGTCHDLCAPHRCSDPLIEAPVVPEKYENGGQSLWL